MPLNMDEVRATLRSQKKWRKIFICNQLFVVNI